MTAKDVIDKAYQTVTAGDIPAFLGLLDDKVEWTGATGFPTAEIEPVTSVSSLLPVAVQYRAVLPRMSSPG